MKYIYLTDDALREATIIHWMCAHCLANHDYYMPFKKDKNNFKIKVICEKCQKETLLIRDLNSKSHKKEEEEQIF